MIRKNLIAFYGGTFDPIHYGHLYSAIALFYLTNASRIVLLPNHIPPHKPQPIATPQQRIKMLKLALNHNFKNIFTIDTREIMRNNPSWTINTFEQLRIEYGSDRSIGLIMGQDSLLKLHTWHRGFELINLCHILVCSRPGYNNYSNDLYLLNNRFIQHPLLLHNKPAGLIFQSNAFRSSISANKIRKMYQSGISCNTLVPSAVQNYINKNNLYR